MLNYTCHLTSSTVACILTANLWIADDMCATDKDLLSQLESGESEGEGGMMLDTLSGFFIIVSAQEEILFVSENVEKHIGLKQVPQ